MQIKAPIDLSKIPSDGGGWRILGDHLKLRFTDTSVPDCGPSGFEGRANQIAALGTEGFHWSTKQIHTHRILVIGEEIELWEGIFDDQGATGLTGFSVSSIRLRKMGPNDLGLATFIGQIEADGILTSHSNTLGVTVADCMPIGLSLGKWRGLLHSGWQGTGILRLALAVLSKLKSPQFDQTLRITLGPTIEAGDYAVPPDRARLFSKRFGLKSIFTCADGQPGLDLLEANLSLIDEVGADFGEIEVQYCKGSSPKIPFLQSYRRDGANYARSLVIFQNPPLSEMQ